MWKKNWITRRKNHSGLARYKDSGNVFDGVFLCYPFSPLDVLGEIWDVIESVSEGFLTYSNRNCNR